jgi:hypothetical protein
VVVKLGIGLEEDETAEGALYATTAARRPQDTAN